MTHTSNDVHALNLDAFRQRLEQQLQERLDILADLAPRALPSVDPVAYQTAASHRLVVGQISAALNRLDAGTYGRCIRCEGRIAPARLEVLPHAAACIECQSHAEG
jgi:DnaK suppressor protein